MGPRGCITLISVQQLHPSVDFIQTSHFTPPDVLDRVDQFDDFDPRQHYSLTLSRDDMTDVERNAGARTADDISLDL